MQTIDLTAGAVEYTWPVTITETSGLDITSDEIQVSLGQGDQPSDTWLDPDLDSSPQPNQRVVQLQIGSALKPAPGTYWLWTRILDRGEVIPRKQLSIRII